MIPEWKYEKEETKGQGPLLLGEESKGPKYRTKTERTTQVLRLLRKLEEVAELHRGLSGIREFQKRGNEFIKTGERFEGKIKFSEIDGMSLIVVLSSNKNVECSISIKNHKMGRFK